MIRRLLIGAAALAAFAASGVSARPVTDCPNRDAPFSADAPVIDLLLSPAARAILEREMGSIDRAPARFFGTTPPTFAAILTLKEASRFTGMKPERIGAVDAELRKLPVTDADRVARCARYDNEVPVLDLPDLDLRGGKRPRVLLFEKITGFKDEPSVNAAHAAIRAMAERKGWAVAVTDKGGAINPRTLRGFDVVVWNNISGDVLTLSQRAALRRWLERGGGFVAVHGSAGDFAYWWDWYPDQLIGARFIGHPMNPQFQEARVVTNTAHPIAAGLPAEWRMTDEWYSFRPNPRLAGAQVVLTLDESTYKPSGPMGVDIRMGEDHPIAWTRCIGPKGRERGRMFYSAIGHMPETYAEPNHVRLLESAITWAATNKRACPGGK